MVVVGESNGTPLAVLAWQIPGSGEPGGLPSMGLHSWTRLQRLSSSMVVVIGFPGGSDGKESTCNVGDVGSIPGLGRSPGGGHGNLLQYSYLENPHGQRSLTHYSPWGCRVEHD